MLDFGLTQPPDGGLVALAPEVLIREVERIVEFDFRVGLRGEGLEIRLAFGNGGGGAAGARGGKCGRGGYEGG